MDIYSAETQVKKLLSYVEGLSADSSKKLYSSSRTRLRELAVTCAKVVQVISDVLQEEILNDDCAEFASSDAAVRGILRSMESEMSNLRQFADPNDATDRDPSMTSDVTASAKKRAMYAYKECLHQLVSASSTCPEAHECAVVIWSWFKSRFVDNTSTSFKYNMKRFPIWIRDIVILYGYALEARTVDSFVAQFKDWIDSIYTSENADRYAVPYIIYQFDKSPDPSKMTLTAAVLWDMLLDMGLSNICTGQDSGLYLSEDLVYTLCNTLNPDVLNDYKHYADHPEVLSKCYLQERGN